MAEKQIDERALKILKEVIQRYIISGQPVGSKKLAEESSMMLSSATIRNILADLEARGYLTSPHTSAGRVPTQQMYRLFVDNLLTIEPISTQKVAQLKLMLDTDCDNNELAERASSLLSSITRLAGIVSLPQCKEMKLKHVEFLALSHQRVLVILVINDHDVQNRVIHTKRDYTTAELQQAGNYLTENYNGKDLLVVRRLLLKELRTERNALEEMIQTIMNLAEKFEENNSNQYILAGESNLFAAFDESSYQKLRKLFEAFAQKHDILHLLDNCLASNDLQIYIGDESGHASLDDYSVVTKPYTANNKVVGVLGVIGPTRMPYQKVISAVDLTAKLLSQALAND